MVMGGRGAGRGRVLGMGGSWQRLFQECSHADFFEAFACWWAGGNHHQLQWQQQQQQQLPPPTMATTTTTTTTTTTAAAAAAPRHIVKMLRKNQQPMTKNKPDTQRGAICTSRTRFLDQTQLIKRVMHTKGNPINARTPPRTLNNIPIGKSGLPCGVITHLYTNSPHMDFIKK